MANITIVKNRAQDFNSGIGCSKKIAAASQIRLICEAAAK